MVKVFGFLYNPIYRHFIIFIKPLLFAVVLIVLSLIMATGGYMIIEGYTLLEAWYMAVITFATVGFMEVRPLSDTGRLFTSFIILFNVFNFTYTVSVITFFISEGKLEKIFLNLKMDHKISKLHHHTIICGCGKYGSEIAQQFINQGLPFVVIDNQPETFKVFENKPQVLYMVGDVTHDEVLLEAGIERASALVSSLNDDTGNVYVVLTARQLNPHLRIVSRGVDEKSERKLRRAGANYVIMPDKIGGFYMASLVANPQAVEFFHVVTNDKAATIHFEDLPHGTLPPSLCNKTIRDLEIRNRTGANVIGIKTPESTYIVNPEPDTPLRPGMHLIVLGHREQVQSFKNLIAEHTLI